MATKNPILHILVVGFHHKKGCQVEFSYPPLIAGTEGRQECPSGWKYLPTLGLPDGSHNFNKDFVCFNLPSLVDPHDSIYGISCYRQIPVEELKIRTADVTRSTVQKSVCALLSIPIYGYVEVKLSLIAHAYFEQGDFDCTEILVRAYEQLNACLTSMDPLEELAPSSRLHFVGLPLRELVLKWRHKLLMLYKLLLLQKRVVCYGSPVQPICALILGVVSLHPGLLADGFQEVACVKTSRPMSPMPTFGTPQEEQKKFSPVSASPVEEKEASTGPSPVDSPIEPPKEDHEDTLSAGSTKELTTTPGSDEVSQCSLEDAARKQPGLVRETSVDTIAANFASLCAIKPDEWAAPIRIFHMRLGGPSPVPFKSQQPTGFRFFHSTPTASVRLCFEKICGKMASISLLNPKAEFARAAQALAVNIGAAKGIQDVMRTNLGPKGTMKMLVSGAGDIKITKDGNVLLHEMQIQHPTASLIARASTTQDDMTGDGTTTTVLLIGELLKQADLYIGDGLHPRILAEGFDQARQQALQILDQMAVPIEINKENLLAIARTSLMTKVHPQLAALLTEVCVDAVLAIRTEGKPVDLHMVELMEMQHKSATDTQLVRGIVMDHGSRHPDMPKRLENAYILTCNVSMEYEKSEVNSGFFYKTAEEREKFVLAEREFIEQRVQKIIELKRKVCTAENGKTFVVINQKGIDPMSLDMLAKEGIMALRRAKRRNMERLALACGGIALNSFDQMDESTLGQAGLVYEHVLGENKFTFVEDCKNPLSVTILVKGPNKYTLTQIKDAVRDGLRSINNAIDDGKLVPGAAAFEVRCHNKLKDHAKDVKGKTRLAIQAYADALLVIPKVLAVNSGYDAQDTIVRLQEESRLSEDPIGLDLSTGEPMKPVDLGVFDNYIVKKQILNSCTVIASNLLLVDEIMRAGMTSLKG